jgi:hypothetical protein
MKITSDRLRKQAIRVHRRRLTVPPINVRLGRMLCVLNPEMTQPEMRELNPATTEESCRFHPSTAPFAICH